MSTPSKPYLSANAAQDAASFFREASVAAASENFPDHVQPPTEMSVFSFGCAALSSCSWWKLPRSTPGSHVSPG
jgi:hypothetical protein